MRPFSSVGRAIRSGWLPLLILLLSAVLFLCACGNAAEPFPLPAPVTPAAAEAAPAPAEAVSAPLPPVEIDGVLFSAETPRLVLTGLSTDNNKIEQLLPRFPNLTALDLRGTSVTQEEAMSLAARYPQISMVWDVTLFGRVFSSDAKEIDLSGTEMEDSSEVESSLKYFTGLEKVIMSDCGFSNEYMDELNRRYDGILFVWTVRFSVYSLRTDATMFCASDVPRLGNVAPELSSQELDPIKYCTEMEALDLGHMAYKDINFLSGMTKMKYLILVQGKFSDISPIANMPDLEYLELFNNNRIIDLTPLLSCKNLKHLNIGYCYFAEWEPLKQMPWLARLWMPHVEISDDELVMLQAALPDTLIYAPLTDAMGSTGGGWREDPSYYEMRDIMGMPYLPGGTGMGLGW